MRYWMPTCDYDACIVVKDTSNLPHGDRELTTACGKRVVAGWDERVDVVYAWVDEGGDESCDKCKEVVFGAGEKDESCSA